MGLCRGLHPIEKEEEIGKYYMHGVSHHLGIDVHDVSVASNSKLPGANMRQFCTIYVGRSESVLKMTF